MPIKKGDLVCMHRRRIRGQGIALEVAAVDAKTNRSIVEIAVCMQWQEKMALEEKFLKETAPTDRAFVTSVMNYYSSQRRAEDLLKPGSGRVFVRVHWFISPSYYTMDRMPTSESYSWVPASWLKILKEGK